MPLHASGSLRARHPRNRGRPLGAGRGDGAASQPRVLGDERVHDRRAGHLPGREASIETLPDDGGDGPRAPTTRTARRRWLRGSSAAMSARSRAGRPRCTCRTPALDSTDTRSVCVNRPACAMQPGERREPHARPGGNRRHEREIGVPLPPVDSRFLGSVHPQGAPASVQLTEPSVARYGTLWSMARDRPKGQRIRTPFAGGGCAALSPRKGIRAR